VAILLSVLLLTSPLTQGRIANISMLGDAREVFLTFTPEG
jgi:hypothetical protein